MRTLSVAVIGVVVVLGASAQGQQTRPAAPAAHVLVTPGEVKWGPAPPVLPAGAQIAVLDGDPSKAGFFVLRLRFPDGYRIAAHTHPTDEHITVMEGTFRAGMGDSFSDAGLRDFPVGSYIKMPREMRHFAAARGEVIVQIEGQGPFVVNYVNPGDDPSTKTPAR